MPTVIDRPIHTAYHEVAHAVIVTALGYRSSLNSMRVRPGVSNGGYITYTNVPKPQRLAICFAGMVMDLSRSDNPVREADIMTYRWRGDMRTFRDNLQFANSLFFPIASAVPAPAVLHQAVRRAMSHYFSKLNTVTDELVTSLTNFIYTIFSYNTALIDAWATEAMVRVQLTPRRLAEFSAAVSLISVPNPVPVAITSTRIDFPRQVTVIKNAKTFDGIFKSMKYFTDKHHLPSWLHSNPLTTEALRQAALDYLELQSRQYHSALH